MTFKTHRVNVKKIAKISAYMFMFGLIFRTLILPWGIKKVIKSV